MRWARARQLRGGHIPAMSAHSMTQIRYAVEDGASPIGGAASSGPGGSGAEGTRTVIEAVLAFGIAPDEERFVEEVWVLRVTLWWTGAADESALREATFSYHRPSVTGQHPAVRAGQTATLLPLPLREGGPRVLYAGGSVAALPHQGAASLNVSEAGQLCWEQVTQVGTAPTLESHAACRIGLHAVALFGGSSGGESGSALWLATVGPGARRGAITLRWSQPEVTTPLPCPRVGASMAQWRGALLVFGGRFEVRSQGMDMETDGNVHCLLPHLAGHEVSFGADDVITPTAAHAVAGLQEEESERRPDRTRLFLSALGMLGGLDRAGLRDGAAGRPGAFLEGALRAERNAQRGRDREITLTGPLFATRYMAADGLHTFGSLGSALATRRATRAGASTEEEEKGEGRTPADAMLDDLDVEAAVPWWQRADGVAAAAKAERSDTERQGSGGEGGEGGGAATGAAAGAAEEEDPHPVLWTALQWLDAQGSGGAASAAGGGTVHTRARRAWASDALSGLRAPLMPSDRAPSLRLAAALHAAALEGRPQCAVAQWRWRSLTMRTFVQTPGGQMAGRYCADLDIALGGDAGAPAAGNALHVAASRFASLRGLAPRESPSAECAFVPASPEGTAPPVAAAVRSLLEGASRCGWDVHVPAPSLGRDLVALANSAWNADLRCMTADGQGGCRLPPIAGLPEPALTHLPRCPLQCLRTACLCRTAAPVCRPPSRAEWRSRRATSYTRPTRARRSWQRCSASSMPTCA